MYLNRKVDHYNNCGQLVHNHLDFQVAKKPNFTKECIGKD